jgi:hypothetical protein
LVFKDPAPVVDEARKDEEHIAPKELDAHEDEPASPAKETVHMDGSDDVASPTLSSSGSIPNRHSPTIDSPSSVVEVSPPSAKQHASKSATQPSSPPRTPKRGRRKSSGKKSTKGATNSSAIELLHSDDEDDALSHENEPENFGLATVTMEGTVFTPPCVFSVNVSRDRYRIVTKSPPGSPGTTSSSTSVTSFHCQHITSLHFHYARPDSTSSPNTRSTHPAAQEICFLSISVLHSPPQTVTKHALLEFKSDIDLLRCIEVLRTASALQKLLEGAELPPKLFASHAQVLLAHYASQKTPATLMKARRDRFVGDQHPDQKLFYYPLEGCDAEKIEDVANNLTEAKGPAPAGLTSHSSPNLPITGHHNVLVGDYLRLAPGVMLNDPLINFFLCWYVPFSL